MIDRTERSMGNVDPTEVETPIGTVDLSRARTNAEKVVEYGNLHGLAWRPHIKTHKSLTVAALQLEAGARGLTVATLREAEVMSTLTEDILIAYPPVGSQKLDRLMRLPEHVDIKVALDSPEVMTALGAAATAAGRDAGVLVEQDLGMSRVGVANSDLVVELACRIQDTPGVAFRGVMFYPGHIRMSVEDQADHLDEVARGIDATVDALGAAGLPPEIVSGGSTPTLWHSHRMGGLTEIRSGSCIYYDREGLDIGVAGRADIAYTVLATVVSTAVPGRAVVDAGSKALAKESRGGGGFGVLLDRPDVLVTGVSEEHGVLDISSSEWTPRIGERVRIIPNHVCVSVNLQDQLLAFDGEACTLLPIEGRGRAPWSP